MTLYPLDTVRNASIDRSIEPMLEEIRLAVESFPFSLGELGGTEDVLEIFDASRPRLNLIGSLLRTLHGGTGLDIGTGFGFLPVLLSRLGITAYATERDVALAQFASAHGVAIGPYTIGADPTPAPHGSLDFLVLAEVLEHMKAPLLHILSEIVPMLRPGGRFILTTPNIARLAHIETLVAGENFLEPFGEAIPRGTDATDYVEHVREYSIREVVEAVEGARVAVDQVLTTGWGENGYALLANPWLNEIIVVLGTY